jgi:hypothetical protein
VAIPAPATRVSAEGSISTAAVSKAAGDLTRTLNAFQTGFVDAATAASLKATKAIAAAETVERITVNDRSSPPPLPRRRWLWVVGSFAAFVAVLAATFVNGVMSNGIPSTIFWRSRDLYQDPVMIRLANAVAAEDVQQIDALVAQGADVNATGTRGLGLLMWAMAKNSPKGFARLLDHGVNPRLPALDSTTAQLPQTKCPRSVSRDGGGSGRGRSPPPGREARRWPAPERRPSRNR